MAPKITGAATATEPAVTATAEPVVTPAEPANQDNNATPNIQELQSKLQELTSLSEKLEKERNEAVAERLRQEAIYRGYQNQTTKTLQQAAQDRKALEQATKDRAELAEIRESLSTVVNHLLDDDERKDLEYRQRELKLKLAEQAIVEARTAPAEPVQATTSPQYNVNPVNEKAQFLHLYFPALEIDPNDPKIDWGDGAASTPEAFARFTQSIYKIKDAQDAAKTQDVVATIQQEQKKQIQALESQVQELAKKTATEIAAAQEAAKTEAAEAARKESEKRLRKMGVDVSGTPTSDGARRTLNQQIANELDDSLLSKGPEGVREYNRRFEVIKKQVRGSF